MIPPAVPPFKGSGTVRDAAAFRRTLEQFHAHAMQQHRALFNRVMAETLSGLVLANPVGNPDRWQRPRKGYVGGHSRRNWQVSLTPEAVPEIAGVDPSGRMATDQGYAAIAALPMAQPGRLASTGTTRAYLVNVVPYMERLNQGWSRQAPAGWIDAVLARVMAKHARVK